MRYCPMWTFPGHTWSRPGSAAPTCAAATSRRSTRAPVTCRARSSTRRRRWSSRCRSASSSADDQQAGRDLEPGSTWSARKPGGLLCGDDLADVAGWWGVVEVPSVAVGLVVDEEDVAVAGHEGEPSVGCFPPESGRPGRRDGEAFSVFVAMMM